MVQNNSNGDIQIHLCSLFSFVYCGAEVLWIKSRIRRFLPHNLYYSWINWESKGLVSPVSSVLINFSSWLYPLHFHLESATHNPRIQWQLSSKLHLSWPICNSSYSNDKYNPRKIYSRILHHQIFNIGGAARSTRFCFRHFRKRVCLSWEFEQGQPVQSS